jgi:ABC-2 type transport system ATP-binding protein
MRMILGLDAPNAGTATVNGRTMAHLDSPLGEVGSLLEARAAHPGRSARDHLRVLAASHHIPNRRVDEVIELTGLTSVAKKRVKGFSLGMGQRLGIASALLGDPQTIILDEPVNGLDPEGVLWVRNIARHLAGEGRTVFLSSHLMSEMAQTADHVIVIGKGKILADAPIAQFIEGGSTSLVRVRTTNPDALTSAMTLAGGAIVPSTAAVGAFDITGLAQDAVAEIAMNNRIVLTELTTIQSSLEQAYMELTADAVEYHTGPVGTDTTTTPGGQR